MRLNGRHVFLIFLSAALLEFVVKGSSVPLLAGQEPLIFVYLTLLALSGDWRITFMYLSFSILADLSNFRPVALNALALYLAYFILKLMNRLFNLMGESGYLFSILVLTVSIILQGGIVWLLNQSWPGLSLGILIINGLLFTLVFLGVNSIAIRDGYKR
jgi:hypothetical protein